MIFRILLFSILVPSLFAADTTKAPNSDPNKWIVVKPPAENDRDAFNKFYAQANWYDHEWYVKLVGKKVTAQEGSRLDARKENLPPFDTTIRLEVPLPFSEETAPGPQAVAHLSIKVSDGWIIAYNQGEFGAGVYWFSDDGKEKQWLSGHHVNEFLVDGDRVFAVEGLAHMMSSMGSIIEIKKDNNAKGVWKITEFLKLPAAGDAIAKVGTGDYVVVTTCGVLRFNFKKELSILLLNEDFGGLYPNSVALDAKFIYIGMRQYVVRFPLTKSLQTKFDLLVPDMSWIVEKSSLFE